MQKDTKYASIHSVIKLGLSWPHYCKIKGAAYEVNSQYVVLAFVRRFLSAWPVAQPACQPAASCSQWLLGANNSLTVAHPILIIPLQWLLTLYNWNAFQNCFTGV